MAETYFLVERRLVSTNEQQLDMLLVALSVSAARFRARGEAIRHVWSAFLPRQDRVLSLFAASSLELVRAVNDAALAPYSSIDPARELPCRPDADSSEAVR